MSAFYVSIVEPLTIFWVAFNDNNNNNNDDDDDDNDDDNDSDNVIHETNRHFATRIRVHLSSYKHSHIFKHLRSSENCCSLCSEDCFKILDSASTSFLLKIKEAMHILWEQPSLNSQVKHLNLSLSY